MTRARLRRVILSLGQRFTAARYVSSATKVVADASNPLDQVLAGRIVPAVNAVEVVGHGAILPHSIRGRVGAIFCRHAAPPIQQRQPR